MKLYKGWQVALAGLGINFLAGISYTWSLFARGLTGELGWSQAQAALPYTVFLFSYAISMVIAGGIQDKAGPRPTITVGGVLIGSSFIFSSFIMTPYGVALTWGLLFGAGLACCFGSVTPAAMKWFPPHRRGLVAGVVVTGIGLSALVLSPLVNSLVARGVSRALFVSGLVLVAGIVMLAQLVSNPGQPKTTVPAEEGFRLEILRTPYFYIMWMMFCLTSVAGLTVATHLDRIARVQASFDRGYIMVSIFALFNAAGRPLSGLLSDILGRERAMTVIFGIMTLVLAALTGTGSAVSMALAVSCLGLTYGGVYSLFPAATAALFGERNFGLNYGLVFTAIGVAGIFPLITGHLFDRYGNFTLSFILLAVFCALAVVLSLFLRKPASRNLSAGSVS